MKLSFTGVGHDELSPAVVVRLVVERFSVKILIRRLPTVRHPRRSWADFDRAEDCGRVFFGFVSRKTQSAEVNDNRRRRCLRFQSVAAARSKNAYDDECERRLHVVAQYV